MTTELLNFCRNVKYLRKAYALSQKDMAQICGISVSALRKIEREILPPRLSVEPIMNLSTNFKILPSLLFIPLDTTHTL